MKVCFLGVSSVVAFLFLLSGSVAASITIVDEIVEADFLSTDAYYGKEIYEDDYCDESAQLQCSGAQGASPDCGNTGNCNPYGGSSSTCMGYDSWVGEYYCVHSGMECHGRCRDGRDCYVGSTTMCSSEYWWFD